MEYVIIDLEFNQPFNFPNGKRYRVVPLCPFEIIQIGAVKVNEQFEVMDTFNSFVKPVMYPRIHPFVEKITGIKRNNLVDADGFEKVFVEFLKFLGDKNRDNIIFCIWGNDDLKFLFRNILFHKMDIDNVSRKYVNVQNYASRYLKVPQGQAVGLKSAVNELTIEPNLSFHNALNDALYTAKIFDIVKPEKITPTIVFPEKFIVSDENAVEKPRVKMDELYEYVCGAVGGEELTQEQRKMVKLAYMAGRDKDFDYKDNFVKDSFVKDNNNNNKNNNRKKKLN